jgi:hypothetical protein
MVRSPDGQLQQVTGFAFDRLTVLKQPYNDIPVRVGGAIRPK